MSIPRAKACNDTARILTKATMRAAQAMQITQRDLGKIIGLSAPTVSRMRRGEVCLPEGQKPWELSLQLVRLFRGLDALVGGDEASMLSWLHSYNTELQCTPVERLSSIQGLIGIADYVDAYRAQV